MVTDVSTGSYTGVVFPVQGANITTPADYPTGSLACYQGSFQTMADLAQALNSDNPPFARLLPDGIEFEPDYEQRHLPMRQFIGNWRHGANERRQESGSRFQSWYCGQP